MPNAPEPPPSLRTLVDAIAALETQYAAFSVTGIAQGREKSTLQFLASLKELVQSFCLQGSDHESECTYVCPYGLRGQ